MASRGHKKRTLRDLSRENSTVEDWEAYVQEIQKGSDRSEALLSAASIDHLLVWKLRLHFVILTPDEENRLFHERHSLLGSLSDRIEMSYLLRIINKAQKDDLDIIRKIRNAFAHSLKPISFETDIVAFECNKLKNHSSTEKSEIFDEYTPRQKFINTAVNIINFLFAEIIISLKRETEFLQKNLKKFGKTP